MSCLIREFSLNGHNQFKILQFNPRTCVMFVLIFHLLLYLLTASVCGLIIVLHLQAAYAHRVFIRGMCPSTPTRNNGLFHSIRLHDAQIATGHIPVEVIYTIIKLFLQQNFSGKPFLCQKKRIWIADFFQGGCFLKDTGTLLWEGGSSLNRGGSVSDFGSIPAFRQKECFSLCFQSDMPSFTTYLA